MKRCLVILLFVPQLIVKLRVRLATVYESGTQAATGMPDSELRLEVRLGEPLAASRDSGSEPQAECHSGCTST